DRGGRGTHFYALPAVAGAVARLAPGAYFHALAAVARTVTGLTPGHFHSAPLPPRSRAGTSPLGASPAAGPPRRSTPSSMMIHSTGGLSRPWIGPACEPSGEDAVGEVLRHLVEELAEGAVAAEAGEGFQGVG